MQKQYLLLTIMLCFFGVINTYGQDWVQIGSDIDGEVLNNQSGYSVSLSSDGSIVAIGAPRHSGNGENAGHVRVYKNISGTWTQQGSDIDGEAAGDNSGWSVSLSSDGSTVAIGAPYNNGRNIGHVRVYKNISGTWTQIGSDIDGDTEIGLFGRSVSLSSDGSIVAIGAPTDDYPPTSAGHVRVYKNLSGTWTQIGSDIDGEAVGDKAGWSVSLSSDGSIVAIGSLDGADYEAGQVRIYKNISGNWTRIGLDIDGEATGNKAGWSVSLSSDGSIVAIGAPQNDGAGNDAGHVRIYKNVSGTWTQIGSDIEGEAADDQSGYSVSLSSDGSTVAIGAVGNDGNGSDAGHVRIYKNISGTWTQQGLDIDGEVAGDLFGGSVSLSSDGSIVAVGAFTARGPVRIFTTNTTSIDYFQHNQTIQIHPNPTKDMITISVDPKYVGVSFAVASVTGEKMIEGKIENADTKINIKEFTEGVYFIQLGNEIHQSFKIMKQ